MGNSFELLGQLDVFRDEKVDVILAWGCKAVIGSRRPDEPQKRKKKPTHNINDKSKLNP